MIEIKNNIIISVNYQILVDFHSQIQENTRFPFLQQSQNVTGQHETSSSTSSGAVSHDTFFTSFEKSFHELRRVFELEIRNKKRALRYDVSEFKRTRFSSFTFLTSELIGIFITHFFQGNYSFETFIFDSLIEIFEVFLRICKSIFLSVMTIQSMFNMFFKSSIQ